MQQPTRTLVVVEEVQTQGRRDPRAEPEDHDDLAAASPILARILLTRRAAVVDLSHEPRRPVPQRPSDTPGLAWRATAPNTPRVTVRTDG